MSTEPDKVTIPMPMFIADHPSARSVPNIVMTHLCRSNQLLQ